MVHKNRKTKGIKPLVRKTDRRETDPAIRHRMVVKSMEGTTLRDIARFYEKDRSTVVKIVQKAERRAKRDRVPLQALSNVQNSPGKRHRPRVYTDGEEREIYNKVTKNRAERKKPALAHIAEIGLKCKESTFEKLMYKFRSHHLPGGEKPELNEGCMRMRQELATLLLDMDLKNIVFLDEANARTEYGKEHLWHTPEEYLHLDVKQPTTKQGYQKAEFVGAIKWGEPPGPYCVFKPETDTEKKEAELLIQKMQEEDRVRLLTEFQAQEDVKNEAARVKGQKRQGKKPSFEVFFNAHKTKRGNREQGSGID